MKLVRLAFDHSRIPRTTTRAQWREIDRWRRTTENAFRKQEEWLRDYIARYGTSALAADLVDGLVNPAIMVYP